MKISIVFLGSTGAGPVYSFEFAKALLKHADCEIQLIISKEVENIDNWKNEFDGQNVDFNIIETYKHTSLAVGLSFFQFWKTNKLVKLIKKYHPDFVFFPFGLTWSPIVFPQISKFTNIVTTLHDPHPHDVTHNLLIRILNRFSSKAQKKVDGIVILNKTDYDYVKKTYNKDIAVIPHASFDYYAKTTDNESKKITKTIGFIGRIEPYKGLDLLVESFVLNPDSSLKMLIAGSGKIDDDTKLKIDGDKRIILYNRYIEENEFPSLFKKIDFLVLPYKRASQSGVIPMSFAFGVPVIATNVGALSEQIPEGTGVIVSPDKDSISEAINYMYKDASIITEMGKKAKKYSDENMTWSQSAELLLSFLRKLKDS